MHLNYLPVHFKLHFFQPVCVDTHPIFVLRSVLGRNLRRMCCIAHTQDSCALCTYNKTCAYAFIFETILPTDNKAQPGRNRASHPFAFTSSQKLNKPREVIKEYDFTITLFGKAIEYLPYIYAAFVQSGIDGVFKSRTPFVIEKVNIDGKNILEHPNTEEQYGNLCLPEKTPIWEFSETISNKRQNTTISSPQITKGEVLVELISPLRFKTQGRYTKDFDAFSFMKCLFRRTKTLCLLYGSGKEDLQYPIEFFNLKVAEKKLYWKDLAHYSARQKKTMELGGVVGHFKLEGNFLPLDIALLDFNKIANAGKNTNFGLGQINLWKQL